MKFAPDGYFFMSAVAAVTLLLAWLSRWTLIVMLPLAALAFWFFRDPERTPEGAGLVSPADGEVIEICETEHPYTGKALKIGIFMNVFSVHVNRMPSAGTIEYLEYVPGKKWFANADKASLENERMYVGYSSEDGPVLLTQIAGLVARRIVCRLKKGDRLERAQRFGMIKFGSKVDVYLPLSLKCTAKVGQKVTAGQTVVAVRER
ncbi:phosphatidylserine decarboxylase [Pyramidobacter sp. SM-530-WT-4B]|uniref:Phosphatidylserine decarboxylase proenzyme n=1 Tax=Pyramidobacter porci TaxID=2605789 RepID=A0A6L5YA43_9BACT|nr:phosphatidylserine decarboxylase [Pyramidobacter porci]MCI6261089.1 phosphatidylserine decarboxylase [Pyramidobacter sp.]MST54995.1 phosphatidylserine decarboxylase [Pyramidobacter porci]